MKSILILIISSLMALHCSQAIKILPSCESRFLADDFLKEANQLRLQFEAEPLVIDLKLSDESKKWAEYISSKGQIVHYDAQGRGPLDRLKNVGINKRLVAQNIANVPILATSNRVIDSWKSRKEEENLVNPFYNRLGYGVASLKNGCVLVLLLTE